MKRSASDQGSDRPEISWVSLIRTARVPYSLLAIVAAGLLLPPQLRDMLVALSETDRMGAVLAFPLSMAFFAFCCWFWARAAISARFDLPDSLAAWSAAVAAGEKGMGPRLLRMPLLLVPQAPIPLAALLGLGIALRSDALGLGLLSVLAVATVWVAIFGRRMLRHLRGPAAADAASAENASESNVALQSTRHFAVFLGRAPTRFMTLLRRAPFGPGAAGALLAISLLIFAVTALASFFPAHQLDDPRNLIWTAFQGPTPVLVGCGFIVAPLTAIAFVLDGWRPNIRLLGAPIGFARPPVMIALVLASSVTPLLVNLHAIRHLPPGRLLQTPLTEQWAAWQAGCGPTTRPVIVAISGGASRAALWGAAVLAQVENAAEGHDAAIFAISSVSGGSLGAAAYMAARAAEPPGLAGAAGCRMDPASHARFGAFARRLAAADAIGPLLAGVVLSDVPRALLGWAPALFGIAPEGGDRATAIERAFEANAQEAANHAGLPIRPFDSSFLALQAPNRPIWIANGTERDTGMRALTTPTDSAGWPFAGAGNLLRQISADVTISTAINNTARFPFLEPSGLSRSTMAKDSGISVIDGGYYDNSGLDTALELARWLQAQGADPVLVQATGSGEGGGYENGMGPRHAVQSPVIRCGSPTLDPNAAGPAHSIADLFAPLIGLIGVREGHVEALLERVVTLYCSTDRQRFFHFYLGPRGDEDVPLNWVLSAGMARHIWISAGHEGGGEERTDPYVRANLAESGLLGAALATP